MFSLSRAIDPRKEEAVSLGQWSWFEGHPQGQPGLSELRQPFQHTEGPDG